MVGCRHKTADGDDEYLIPKAAFRREFKSLGGPAKVMRALFAQGLAKAEKRVVNIADIVPQVPLPILYRHARLRAPSPASWRALEEQVLREQVRALREARRDSESSQGSR